MMGQDNPNGPTPGLSGRDLLAQPVAGKLPGNTAPGVILNILALLAGLAGLASLSQATTGVGLICVACLLAVFARMAQARYMHEQIMHRLSERSSL